MFVVKKRLGSCHCSPINADAMQPYHGITSLSVLLWYMQAILGYLRGSDHDWLDATMERNEKSRNGPPTGVDRVGLAEIGVGPRSHLIAPSTHSFVNMSLA